MSANTGSMVARNTFFLSASSTFILILLFGFNVVLARYLGVERFGQYAFVVGFMMIFTQLVEFSLDFLMVRDIARTPSMAGTYFGNALVLKGVFFVLALGLMGAVIMILGYPYPVRWMLYMASLGLLFDGVRSCCISLFNAAQMMNYTGALLALERVLFVMFGSAAIALHGSVSVIILCLVSAKAFTQGTGLILVRRKLRVRPEGIRIRFCVELARRALPFFGVSVSAASYLDMDKVLLLSLQGNAAVGIYGAVGKLLMVASRLAEAFHQAVYPLVSTQASQMERLGETYQRSMKYLMIAVVPLLVTMVMLGERIIVAAYGKAFVQSAVPLRILVWTTALGFFTPFFGRILFALERQKTVFLVTASAAILSFALNIALIPRYSYVGAAVAALVAAALMFGVQFRAVWGYFRGISVGGVVLKPAVAGVAMAVAFAVMKSVPLVPLLVFGVLIYALCLTVSGVFSRTELRHMLSALGVVRGVQGTQKAS